MSAPSPPLPPSAVCTASAFDAIPERLRPVLWRGDQMDSAVGRALPTGFATLDAQLPGGGWPRRALTELLLPHPGVGEIRLLGPCLTAMQRQGRLVMLFDPPAKLSAQALAQLGFDVAQLLVVHTRARVIPGSDSLWAFEQALKSGHVGGVLAWLPPRLRADRLRRLQLAAQAHDGPAFVLRECAAQQRPTAAPLRLALRAGGADRLELKILKRRGPPLASPIVLTLPSVLSDALREQAWRRQRDTAQPAPQVVEHHAHEPSRVGGMARLSRVEAMPLPAATFISLV
jgi:protein ImuA